MHKIFEEADKMTMDTGKAKEVFLKKLAFTTGPDRLYRMIKENLDKFVLIDLREYKDYVKGHIPFAVHIPFEKFEEHLEMLSKDKINILYGYSLTCQRQQVVAYHLACKGYPVRELIGGFKGWKKNDYEIIENENTDYFNQ